MSHESEPTEEDLAGIIEQVQSDPALAAAERQTTINFGKPDDRASVFTEEPALIRRLLRNPYAEVTEIRVLRDDESVRYIHPEDYDGEPVVALDGYIPISVLTIKSEPRTHEHHSQVVSQSVQNEPPTWGGGE